MRPLVEIAEPWLDRDTLEANYWRVTGTRDPWVINELLKLSDVYAASQGPKLAEEVARRREERGRFDRVIDFQVLHFPGSPSRSRNREQKPEVKYFSEPAVTDPQSTIGPSRATPVWEDHGIMFQLCTGCQKGKPYSEFYRDKARWNAKAAQCKTCKGRSNSKYHKKDEADETAESS